MITMRVLLCRRRIGNTLGLQPQPSSRDPHGWHGLTYKHNTRVYKKLLDSYSLSYGTVGVIHAPLEQLPVHFGLPTNTSTTFLVYARGFSPSHLWVPPVLPHSYLAYERLSRIASGRIHTTTHPFFTSHPAGTSTSMKSTENTPRFNSPPSSHQSHCYPIGANA
jgi:hypothetical protein